MPTYDPSKLTAYKSAFNTTYTPPAAPAPVVPPAGTAPAEPAPPPPKYTDKFGQSWDTDAQGKAFESWMDTNKFDASGYNPTAPTGQDKWYSGMPGIVAGEDGTPATGLMGTPALASDEIASITTSGSPLMQRAETRANQEVNKRGLMNSSMGVQAGQAALYDAAMPIAQENVRAKNTLLAQSNDIRQKEAETNLAAQVKLFTDNAANENKVRLANIEADYKTLIQTSASAAEMYKGTMAAVSSIIGDPNMTDPTAKANAINGLFDRLAIGLNIVGSVNGVNFGELLDFDPVTVKP